MHKINKRKTISNTNLVDLKNYETKMKGNLEKTKILSILYLDQIDTKNTICDKAETQ